MILSVGPELDVFLSLFDDNTSDGNARDHQHDDECDIREHQCLFEVVVVSFITHNLNHLRLWFRV